MTNSDTWARDLLERAGDTIEVGTPPALPVAAKPRHWWPVLAAAAAVVLAITAAFALHVGPRAARPEPAPAPAQGSVTAQDLPLVFGMTEHLAAITLDLAGLTYDVRHEQTCEEVPGRVMRVDLSDGRPTLVVASAIATADCSADLADRALAWQLIDVATHRGPGPDRTADCCPDSVLHELARAATRFVPVDGIFNIPPVLVVQPVTQGFEMVIGMQLNHRVTPLARATVEVDGGRVTRVRQGRFSVDPPPPGNEAAVAGTQELVAMVRAGKPYPLDSVDVYLDGRRQAPAADPWKVCPQGSGISCPVDVAALIQQAARVGHNAQPPDVPCAPGTPLALPGLTSITIFPIEDAGFGCATWAVQLWWTADGALRAVNLVLGEP